MCSTYNYQPRIDGFFVVGGPYFEDEPTVNIDLNGDGDTSDMNVSFYAMFFKKNPAGLDIAVTPTND